jgi:tyrosine-protein kinase Etk/Wzc
MSESYSLFGIIQLIWKWRKYLIASIILINLIVGIVLFLKPNYYQAQTSFYAANPTLGNPTPLGYDDQKSFVYGTAEDLDRLQSIATSDEIINIIISKFRLYDHYKYDSLSATSRHNLRLAFKKNYNVTKSKLDAIVIAVEDTDPAKAADIANFAREYTDQVAQSIIKNTQGDVLNTFNENITEQQSTTKSLADSLEQLKTKYELIQVDFQSKAYSEELINAQANLSEAEAKANYFKNVESIRDSFIRYQSASVGYRSQVVMLLSKVKGFNKGVSEMKRMEAEYGRIIDQLSIMKEKEKLLNTVNKNKFSALHIIDKAKIPDYKSRPKRALLLLTSLLLTSLIAVCTVLLIEGAKRTVK